MNTPFPYPEAMEDLMQFLRGLPGVGKRSAERMALQIFKWDDGKLKIFSDVLATLKSRVGTCPECGAMSDGPGTLCSICSSPRRDSAQLCIVEEFAQMRTIEACGLYKGRYHILGGRLAPLEGKMADSLSIEPLLAKVGSGTVKEIIFALSPDVEGQATAVYIAGLLRDSGIRTSRLAQGLPAGSDLNYADPATIAAALSGRTAF